MRTSFLAFTAMALVASTLTAASAFNYVQLGARDVVAAVVEDDDAYLAIAAHDYGCFVNIDATSGKIDVTFDSGSGCAGTGTGVNGYSTYYYHDVLKFTNKGTLTIANIWLNMTDTAITIQTNTAQDTMTTGGTYAAAKVVSNLAVGDSFYVGFKVDASSTGVSTISKTLTVAARNTT